MEDRNKNVSLMMASFPHRLAKQNSMRQLLSHWLKMSLKDLMEQYLLMVRLVVVRPTP